MSRVRGLEARNRSLRAKLDRLETEWVSVSAYSRDARDIKPKFDLWLGQPQQVIEETAVAGWTPALRKITECVGPAIDLRSIRVLQVAKGSEAFVLLVEGISGGGAPRTEADAFREGLQRGLARQFDGVVTTKFDRLEDMTLPSASFDQQGASFQISATVTRPARAGHPSGN